MRHKDTKPEPWNSWQSRNAKLAIIEHDNRPKYFTVL